MTIAVIKVRFLGVERILINSGFTKKEFVPHLRAGIITTVQELCCGHPFAALVQNGSIMNMDTRNKIGCRDDLDILGFAKVELPDPPDLILKIKEVTSCRRQSSEKKGSGSRSLDS